MTVISYLGCIQFSCIEIFHFLKLYNYPFFSCLQRKPFIQMIFILRTDFDPLNKTANFNDPVPRFLIFMAKWIHLIALNEHYSLGKCNFSRNKSTMNISNVCNFSVTKVDAGCLQGRYFFFFCSLSLIICIS